MKGLKIFVSRVIPDNGIRLLENEGFRLTLWEKDIPISQEELIVLVKKHNALLSMGSDKIDKYFLNECRHLDIISQFAVGYDNIDVKEATRLKIPVGNTPGVLSDATADIAFGLMIATSRKMFYMHKSIIRGEWKYFYPKANLGIELRNKTIGIFGLGRIGFEMASRCKGAFNMKIIYCNRNRNEEAEKILGAERVSFDRLLSESDVLSVHCKLSDETKGIFDWDAFRKMKPTSLFINTARGLVHNEKDLIKALKENVIWGAGLDVTNPEPMQPGNPLMDMDNVSVVPHIGSATIEARNEMARLAAENILGFYRTKTVPNILNPEALS